MREGRILRRRYRLDEQVGKGGQAYVFRAYDSRRRADVAVKISHGNHSEDKDAGRHFRREAKTLARLKHPNIVRFYSFEQDGDDVFIVMEYVRGKTLQELIDTQGPLPIADVKQLMREVGHALDYAHSRKIIHRDIKPTNVMVRTDGTYLLSDFGIAKMSDSTTRTLVPLGTPAYMSPEQFRNERVDKRSDVYSLGAVLYKAITGRLPFTGEQGKGSTEEERLRDEHLNMPVPDPRALRPEFPEEASRVIKRALATEPGDRWQNMTDFLQAWEQAWGPDKLEPGTTRLYISPPVPKERRQLRPVIPGILLLVALIILLGLLGRPMLQPRAAPATTPTGVPSSSPTTDSTPFAVAQVAATQATGEARAALTRDASMATQMVAVAGTASAAFAQTAEAVGATRDAQIRQAAERTASARAAQDAQHATATQIAAAQQQATTTQVAAALATARAQTAAAIPAPRTPTPPPRPTGPNVFYGFEDFGTWTRGVQPYGTLAPSDEHVHGGNLAAKLAYEFPAVKDNYVVFEPRPPIAIPGRPTDLTIWVYGDGSDHFLNAWVQDAAGEVQAFNFGRVDHRETWQPMALRLDPSAPWPHDHISGPTNDGLTYPLALSALVLDGAPDGGGPFKGQIYFDDLTVGTVPGADGTATPATGPGASATPVSASPTPAGPPGGHIVFAQARQGTTDIVALDVINKDMWVVRPDGRQPAIRAGDRIVYNGIGNGKEDLFAVNLDGSGERQMSRHPEDSYPHWSPAATQLVIYSSFNGREEIYIMPDIGAGGGEPVGISVAERNLLGRFPVWLSNGRIAYSGCGYQWNEGALCGLWSIDPNGSSPQRLTEDLNDRPTSSRGGYLLFSRQVAGNWDVYLIPDGGGAARNLTNSPGQDFGAAFAPDGGTVAFASDRDGWGIWLMNRDGSNVRKLVSVPGGFGADWQAESLSWGP
jgi:serine/threonine protein kinase